MANPIHRINIVAKDKRSQRKVADSTTKLDKTMPTYLARSYDAQSNTAGTVWRLLCWPTKRTPLSCM